MLDPAIANNWYLPDTLSTGSKYPTATTERAEVNPKLGLAYQTVALLCKDFQWKCGFVQGFAQVPGLFQCTTFNLLEYTSYISIYIRWLFSTQQKHCNRAMSVGRELITEGST